MPKIPGAKFYPAHPSNYWKGRGGYSIKYFTVHHTAGFESSLKGLYQNPARDGSATFFAGDNHYEQYLDTLDTPWTNGNTRSNRESLTCETRGLWMNGYKDGSTLKQLEEIMYQCLLLYPNLKLQYHKDVSNKPTACPADLKDKGYAKQAWDRAQTRVKAKKAEKDVEMLTNLNHMKAMWRQFLGRDPRQDEINGYLGKRTYAYTLDKLYRARLDLRNRIKLIGELQEQITSLKAQIAALGSRPTKDQYQKLVGDMESAMQKLEEAQEKIKDLENEPPVDEREVVEGWFKRLWDSLFNRK